MISTFFLLIYNITLFFKYFTYEGLYISYLIILYKLVTVFILPTIVFFFFLYTWLIFSMDWGNFHATKLYMEWKSYVELLDFNQFCLAIKSHFNYCHFLSVLNLSILSKTWSVILYFLTFKSFSSILFFFN